MKRIFSFVLLLAAVFMTACLADNSKVAVLDEYSLCFGMSPAEVRSKLGDPVESDTSMLVANRSSYMYHTNLLEHSATIQCEFTDDQALARVYIQWSLDSCDQAYRIIEKAEQMIQDSYQNHKNYFKKSKDWQGYEYCVSMGIDYGATGFFYEIMKVNDENTVCINCIAHF